MRKKPLISVITATYNAEKHLPRLIESLINQRNKNFEWIVSDGGSTDKTLKILQNAKRKLNHVVIDSKPDFGIYDALNRGIKLSNGDYYLVVGADDILYPNAIEDFLNAIKESNADFISAKVKVGKSIISSRYPAWEWLYGFSAYVGSHAVGLLIKKSLHQRFGYYSNRFPIVADQYFILKSIHVGAILKKANFIPGEWSQDGTSGSDLLGAMTEYFRIQVKISGSVKLQTFLFILRLIKNINKIKAN